ncbi:hypothetical protein ABVF61_19105 [Roseibium sp. HPY-6]|uniref:hypothetical protein n=1 Tax=Roseibium sp. HPY-6 TaxID=3229852 RepID=UPI00338EAD8E
MDHKPIGWEQLVGDQIPEKDIVYSGHGLTVSKHLVVNTREVYPLHSVNGVSIHQDKNAFGKARSEYQIKLSFENRDTVTLATINNPEDTKLIVDFIEQLICCK